MNQTPLSSRLRTETKAAHTAAERSGIMGQLLRGNINGAAYATLLRNLAALYEALERELDAHHDADALASLDMNRLRRLPSLQHDIEMIETRIVETATDAPHAGTVNGARPDTLVPSTHEYVAHLHALGSNAPWLLFAHAYLRYLGDLYGGQILRGIIEKALGQTVADATSFYDFTGIADIAAFKAEFPSLIDGIVLDDSQRDAMVAEAQRGYEWHARMFAELATTAVIR